MLIPKIIHYCWFGGAPKPKSVQRCINSWKKYCPDFVIREWTEKDVDITQNEYTRQAYEAKAWGFVPDYLRLWIIYNYGGIYLDTDVQVVRDLSPLLEHKAFAGFEADSFVALGLGFGAEQGNPFLYEHMQLYEELRFLNEDGRENRTPAPQYTTRLLRGYGLKDDNGETQVVAGVTIFPREFFCPKDFYTGRIMLTENTFSIHQHDASWFSPEAQAEKQKRWKRFEEKDKKNARKEFVRYLPNRILLKLFGARNYQRIRMLFKRK